MIARSSMLLTFVFCCSLTMTMVACTETEKRPIELSAGQKLFLQERSNNSNTSGFEVVLTKVGNRSEILQTIPGHLIQSVADPQGQWVVISLTVRDEETNDWNDQIWLFDGRQGIYKLLRSSKGMRFAVDDSAGVLCLFDPSNDMVLDGLKTPTIQIYKLPTMSALRAETVSSLKGKVVDAEMSFSTGKFFVRFTDDASTDVRIEIPKD